MANSTSTDRPRKPYPDFPLTPRKDGRWCRQVRGKRHYFSGTAQEALAEWNRVKDDLMAGRKPSNPGDGFTVGALCNRFLEAKARQLAAGEISPRTERDYIPVTDRLVAKFGAKRLVDDLKPEDFELVKADVAKTCGPVAVGNFVQRVRVIFSYGYEAGHLDRPVRLGPMFKRPGRKVLRLERAKKGTKMIEAADLRRIIDAAGVHLKAMIYLALNCGFGNHDCGTLPMEALDLDAGWIDYHRPKTGINRRCWLWPETVKALRASLTRRPRHKSPEHAGLVFVTKYGGSWSNPEATVSRNPISAEFRKLLNETGLHRDGLGFYSLRHIHRTISDEARDYAASDSIMGHLRGDMASVYRERIGDDRLKAVAEHVRKWLFKKAKGDKKRPAGKNSEENSALRIVG